MDMFLTIFYNTHMKIKILCSVIVLLIFFSMTLFANEPDIPGSGYQKPKLSKFVINAGFTYMNNPKLLGGHFEFGFVPINKYFYLENRLGFRAGGVKINDINNTVISITEKLIFGRKSWDNTSGMYVFLEGGFGTYGNENKNFFKDHAYNFGFGGGFEIGDEDIGAIYLEAGYQGQKIISNFPVSGFILQTGWRVYF